MIRSDDARLRAVLRDYQMPRRRGDEVLFDIRRISSVDVWMTSGFLHGAIHEESRPARQDGRVSQDDGPQRAEGSAATVHGELAGFIPKPYGENELRRMLATR